MNNNKRVDGYIARAALWNLIESHQGNQVLYDSIWDELYEKYGEKRADEAFAQAELFLNRIEAKLIAMGIDRDDEDLQRLRDIGLEEIARRRESWFGEEDK